MLILVPPSEGKATRRRGSAMSLDDLSHPELNPARRELIDALAETSSRPNACELLGVSPTLADQVAANLRLDRAPALKASDLYTGVLYDALDFDSMAPATRRRAHRQVRIFSALHGVLSPTDRIAPYRLSAGASLPDIGGVAAWWRARLTGLDDAWAGQLLIDCRSADYRAMWRPSDRSRWVRIEVPGASHSAKHTRGLLARRLTDEGRAPTRPEQVAAALGDWVDSLTGDAKTGWTLSVHQQA